MHSLAHITRSLTLSSTAELNAVTMTQRVGAGADSIVARADLTVFGDSGVARAQGCDALSPVQTLRFAALRGALHQS